MGASQHAIHISGSASQLEESCSAMAADSWQSSAGCSSVMGQSDMLQFCMPVPSQPHAKGETKRIPKASIATIIRRCRIAVSALYSSKYGHRRRLSRQPSPQRSRLLVAWSQQNQSISYSLIAEYPAGWSLPPPTRVGPSPSRSTSPL